MQKILIIDDDLGILEAVKAVLEYGGYEVIATGQTEEIYRLTKKQLPKVILLDLLLSGKDGKKIARELKSHQLTKHIPIIMFSAHPDAFQAAKQSGADDFIAKPFDMNELLDKIDRLVDRSGHNEKHS